MNAVAAFSGFSVDNLAKAKDFYSNTLGLKLTDESMGLNYDLSGGGSVFIYDKPDHKPAEYTMLNFVVTDIDATIDELVGKGVTFERYSGMPTEQDDKGILRGLKANMGPDIAWCKDPAGNIVGILQDS